jgi:hypothetical protein
MRILGGSIAVLAISAIGGFTGQLMGHWLGEGDKNLALQSALIGIVAGALLTAIVITSLAQRSKDWLIAVGAMIAVALEVLAIALIIWQRRA